MQSTRTEKVFIQGRDAHYSARVQGFGLFWRGYLKNRCVHITGSASDTVLGRQVCFVLKIYLNLFHSSYKLLFQF